ncbi:MAG TPA: hypothetical protein VNJ04_19690 [Gemmatimonadaceae bacterium]|nr:hypothetical protein [Gemmatimonadaceae bacterium]
MNVSDWPRYHYRAVVVETPRGHPVVDGDTFDCMVDFGDFTYRRRRIRVLGYDSPEDDGATKAAGLLAADALADIIPLGSYVYLHTKLDRENLDRLLAKVYVEGSDGDLYNVAEAMVSGGFGEKA